MKTSLLFLVLAGGLTAATVMQVNARRQLRDAREAAEQQAAEIRDLRDANERLAAQGAELEQARRDAQDVLRLRGEIARLRRDIAERSAIPQPIAPANTAEDSGPAQIHIKARFIAVPDPNAAAWTSGDQAALLHQSGAPTGRMSPEQAGMMSRDLEKTDGAKVISQPQVITSSGVPASVMIGKSVPFDGSFTNIGLMMDLLPSCQSNSSTVDMSFNIKLRRLTDASPAKDGSLPSLEELSITNSISVPDGQTVVVTGRIPANGPWLSEDSAEDSGRPRNLLIFITPTIVSRTGPRMPGNGESTASDQPASAPVAAAQAQSAIASQPEAK